MGFVTPFGLRAENLIVRVRDMQVEQRASRNECRESA